MGHPAIVLESGQAITEIYFVPVEAVCAPA